jgi:hypothetical protein
MKKVKSKNVLIFLLILLVIYLGLNLFLTKQDYKYEIIQQKSISHVDLSNAQYEFEYKSVSEDDDYVVNATGFVAFYDMEQQPKGLRQYYVIDTEFEGNLTPSGYVSARKFTIKEIIAMPYLPPKVIGTEEMTIKSESDNELILEDESGNMFIVNKQTKQIVTEDVTGDKARLIIDNREYEAFIKNLLKN